MVLALLISVPREDQNENTTTSPTVPTKHSTCASVQNLFEENL